MLRKEGPCLLTIVVLFGTFLSPARFRKSAWAGPVRLTRLTRLGPSKLGSPQLVSVSDGTDGRGLGVSIAQVPLYSFQGTAENQEIVLAKFERIDDVIMGGVSKSQLVPGNGVASWRGLVRTTGGGFCGQRTKPFTEPLNLTGATGLYISCRLASDKDVHRRVWKLSLRTNEGRGEVVYQAPFVPSSGTHPEPIFVPFSDFTLVRGPIAVPDAPNISNTSAIYQIGFTCSKFVIGPTMQGLDNFRNGTFQLDVAELGAYAAKAGEDIQVAQAPDALQEEKVKQRQPWILRVLLFPLLALVFSEAQRRRRRASELLKERGASSWDLARFGWSFKRNLRGQAVLRSALQTGSEAVTAVIFGIFGIIAKLTVFPIFRMLARRRMRRDLGKKAEEGSRLER